MKADQLRASLLQDAVIGKLVPQLDDEPAVEQIGEAPEVIPFEIPQKWKWVRLSAIGKIIGGGTPKTGIPEYWDGDIPWITPADLGKNSNQTIYSGAKLITKKGLDESSAKLMPKGSIVYSSRAPIGHIAISGNELCTNQGCKSFVPETKFISTEWAYYMLIARTRDIQSRASGTTFKEISGKGMGETWISLPPLPEQRRIVARLNELLPLLETYGKEQEQLERLEAELPGKLRASILQEAVMGKLVPQLDDEPAVKQIGKVPDDVPFLIPEKWKWIAAQDAYELLSGRDLQKGEILDVEPEAPSVPYITGASQIIDSRVLITRWTQNCSVKSVKGDLLLTCKGTVGKTAFNTVGDMHIARQIMALRAKPEIVEGKFLRFFIDSIAETLAKNAKSMIPGIDRKTLLKNSIPIPPLKEQRRIVAKVEELMAQVDRLAT